LQKITDKTSEENINFIEKVEFSVMGDGPSWLHSHSKLFVDTTTKLTTSTQR